MHSHVAEYQCDFVYSLNSLMTSKIDLIEIFDLLKKEKEEMITRRNHRNSNYMNNPHS